MKKHNISSPERASETTARRAFLSQVGKAAVTAPAIALLVAASARPAAAQYRPSGDGDSQGEDGGGRSNRRRRRR